MGICRNTRIAIGIAGAALVFGGARRIAAAQSPAPRMGSLAGQVLRDADDQPIAGAEISIPGFALRMLSDSAGTFRLNGIPAGKAIVWVRKIGFSPLSAVMTFVAGETIENDFSLVASTQRLPEVEVKAPAPVHGKLAEFEERRKEGFGHFLTAAQLEKNEGRRMSEVMATIGTRIIRGTTNAAWVVSGRGPTSRADGMTITAMDRSRGAQQGACYAGVMLDGIFVFQGLSGEALWDINSLQPTEIAGVETYSGSATIPSKYNNSHLRCGLVVIWTK